MEAMGRNTRATNECKLVTVGLHYYDVHLSPALQGIKPQGQYGMASNNRTSLPH